jgi:hypothetical protein
MAGRKLAPALLAILTPLVPPIARAQEPGYPQYCCTEVGRLGPFSNGTVNVGERCSVVATDGVRHVGTACHGPRDPLVLGPMDTTGYARHCCTDVGVLGPFADATWQEGDRCAAVAEDGVRHEGVACYGLGQTIRAALNGAPLLSLRHCGTAAASAASLAAASSGSPGSFRQNGSR